MTPEVLARYLQVMRSQGVVQGALTLEGVTLTVVFSPEADPLARDTAPAAGGWKGAPAWPAPSRLDESQAGPSDSMQEIP